jgi:hypothetical protein
MSDKFPNIRKVLKKRAGERLNSKSEETNSQLDNLEATSRFSRASLARINFVLGELRGKYEPEFVKVIEEWLLNLETEAINYLAIKGYFGPIKDNFSAIDQLRMACMIQKTSVPFGLASWWSRLDQPKLQSQCLDDLVQILPPRFPVQMVAKHSNNNDLSQPSDPLIEEFGDFLVGDFLDSEKDNLNYGITGKVIEKIVKTNYPKSEIEQKGVRQILSKRLEDPGVQEKIRDELVKINLELKDFISQVDRTNPLAVQQISKAVSALSVYFMNQISCILLESDNSTLKDLRDSTLKINKPVKKNPIKKMASNFSQLFSKPPKKEPENEVIFSLEERDALMSPSLEFSLVDRENLRQYLVSELRKDKNRDPRNDNKIIKFVIDAIGFELLEVGASPFFVPFFSLITLINPPLGLALSVSAPLLNGPISTFGFLSFIGYLADKNDGFAELLKNTSLCVEANNAASIVKGYRI